MAGNRVRRNNSSFYLSVPTGTLGYNAFDRFGAYLQNRSAANQEAYVWLGKIPLSGGGGFIQDVHGDDPAGWPGTEVTYAVGWLQTRGVRLVANAELALDDGNVQPIYWAGPDGGANPCEIAGWR